jgi:hypothetical protein
MIVKNPEDKIMNPYELVLWGTLGIAGILVLIFGIWKFITFLDSVNRNARKEGDAEETAILDDIQLKLTNLLEADDELKVLKPFIDRKHDHYLQVREEFCDVKNALRTPTVVIQFHQGTRLIELRLYVREFYRSGGSDNRLVKQHSFPLEKLSSAVNLIFPLYKIGFLEES